MMSMVHPMEIIQKVGEVIIFAEWNGQVRRIYTDGRKYSEEKDPTFNGYSTGHWEHGDLVTEVQGFREKVVFNANGIVFTDKMVIHERFQPRRREHPQIHDDRRRPQRVDRALGGLEVVQPCPWS